jgi:hypothetical protein
VSIGEGITRNVGGMGHHSGGVRWAMPHTLTTKRVVFLSSDGWSCRENRSLSRKLVFISGLWERRRVLLHIENLITRFWVTFWDYEFKMNLRRIPQSEICDVQKKTLGQLLLVSRWWHEFMVNRRIEYWVRHRIQIWEARSEAGQWALFDEFRGLGRVIEWSKHRFRSVKFAEHFEISTFPQ